MQGAFNAYSKVSKATEENSTRQNHGTGEVKQANQRLQFTQCNLSSREKALNGIQALLDFVLWKPGLMCITV